MATSPESGPSVAAGTSAVAQPFRAAEPFMAAGPSTGAPSVPGGRSAVARTSLVEERPGGPERFAAGLLVAAEASPGRCGRARSGPAGSRGAVDTNGPGQCRSETASDVL